MAARRILFLILKVMVTGTLLWWLLRSIDRRALMEALAVLDSGSIAIAAALVALQCALLGWRWHRLVQHLGGVLPARLALHWTLVGIFFNQALPSSVGGDAVRIWMLHKRTPQPGTALGSVLVERVSGLVVLGMLVSAAAAVLVAQGRFVHVVSPLLWVGPSLLVGTVALLGFGQLASGHLPAGLGSKLRLLTGAFARTATNPFALVEALLLGAAASGMGLLAAWVLGSSMGMRTEPHVYVALMGGAMLLAVLPVSLGGWGIREASVVALFAAIGMPREPALAMSIVWALLPVLISAPFAAAWWLARDPGQRAGPT